MEKICWTDRVKSEQILYTIKEEYNKKRKANWIGHILSRTCWLEYVIGGKIEGRIEMTG